jgi:signal transduction histidine kinase
MPIWRGSRCVSVDVRCRCSVRDAAAAGLGACTEFGGMAQSIFFMSTSSGSSSQSSGSGSAVSSNAVTLIADTPPRSVLVEADPAAIEQILDNLLDNALNASPVGPRSPPASRPTRPPTT